MTNFEELARGVLARGQNRESVSNNEKNSLNHKQQETEIEFKSKIHRINYSYFALIPKHIISKYSQLLDKGKIVELKLLLGALK